MLFKNRILGFFLAFFAVLLLAGPASAAHSTRLTTSESSVLRAMNSVRASHHLAPLRLDYRLERVARAHSADMLRNQYFAHGAFFARVSGSGAAGPVFGENLAYGPTSATWVVNAWLASPPHRANLLRPGFRRVGVGSVVGTFQGSAGTMIVTADFAGT